MRNCSRRSETGEPINNGKYMSYSTMLAIMGREACYTGEEITWEQAMTSQQRLGPTEYKWGDVEAEADCHSRRHEVCVERASG